MAILPSMNTISGFFVNVIHDTWKHLIPCKICNQGEAVVKKFLGKPIKVYTKPTLCWKIPLIEDFDVVNIKIQTAYLNAHSYLMDSRKDSVVPTNIVIDAQMEYRIIEPLCIYSINEKQLVMCVDNKVHQIIEKAIIELDKDNISYKDFCNRIEQIRKEDSKLETKVLKLNNKRLDSLSPSNKQQEFTITPIIEIEKIVIISCDYNFSIRNVR